MPLLSKIIAAITSWTDHRLVICRRLEYQYSQWQSSNSRTLAVKVHSITTVCWSIGLLKVLILIYRMQLGEVVFWGLKEETLFVLALIHALNVGHNVALTRGLFKRQIW